MSAAAPTFVVREIRCDERPVRLRLPFRFGAVTVTHAPQAFVRVRIGLPDGRDTWGASAELMVPKWFDKNPRLTQEESFDQLRTSLLVARDAYVRDAAPRTAFGHFAAHYAELVEDSARHELPALAGCFGPAEIDKAILDALGRALHTSFSGLVRSNLAGIAPDKLLSEFAAFDFDAFVASLTPAPHIAVRHTVGMLDAIDGHPGKAGDGLPESLEEAIAAYGLRYFKLKLSGDAAQDAARLAPIGALLERVAPQCAVTLDGNEQYDDLDQLATLWERMKAPAPLAFLRRRTLFVEQPVNRQRASAQDVGPVARQVPLIIDESDATLDAFSRARELGYAGVSSKSCKGVYKSLINRARCMRWNAESIAPRWFMSAEDLTTQAGLAVQQDLALAALLGIEHVERNGHHYVDGFAGQEAPHDEQQAFLAAHPDLYERTHGKVRLRIRNGDLAIGSLDVVGFASGAVPDWTSLTPMRMPTRAAERSA